MNKPRDVIPALKRDDDRVAGSFVGVVIVQFAAKAPRFNPHDRVEPGIERRSPKDLGSEKLLLQCVLMTLESLLNAILQESAELG